MNNKIIILSKYLKNMFWKAPSASQQELGNQLDIQTSQKRRSGFLRTLNLVIIVLMLPAIPLSDEIPFIVNGAFLLTYIIIFALNERRYSRPVAFLFCFILMLQMFYVPLARIVEGGVETLIGNSAVLYLISLPVLLAGALISARTALSFALLQTIGLFALLNILAGEMGLSAFSKLFPSISFWWLIGVVIWLYERTLEQAFARLSMAAQNQAQLLKELEEKNGDLQEQIIERLRAEEAAQAANRAKSAFLANMSHELRTPLNAILGFTQLMSRDHGISAQQEESLQIIIRSGEHLLTLINDVLEMSKIEAGRTTLNQQSFDLYGLLEGLEEMFRLRATDKGLQLIFDYPADVPQYVEADQSKLRQVLINLLSNAIKFTQEGRVSLRVAANTDSSEAKCLRLDFEIEDTGLGIAPTELETLFEPFVQTKTGLMQEGTGLGLPISRQFVQMMGSELTVKSQEEWGSLFKFNILVNVVDAAEVQTKPPTARVIGLAPSQPTYRLLVVEDRLENRQLLVKLFTPLGFEVQTANNGQEGLEVWKEWEPHLIWMDMRMHVMDGYEATKRIKATIQGQATVIIALTASALEEERAVVLSAGCDDFVRKPFREAELFDKMALHLGLTYLYEEEKPLIHAPSESQAQALGNASLAPVPPDLLLELEQVTVRANFELIFKLIEQIHAHNAVLADQLSTLAHDFEYAQILKLLQEAK